MECQVPARIIRLDARSLTSRCQCTRKHACTQGFTFVIVQDHVKGTGCPTREWIAREVGSGIINGEWPVAYIRAIERYFSRAIAQQSASVSRLDFHAKTMWNMAALALIFTSRNCKNGECYMLKICRRSAKRQRDASTHDQQLSPSKQSSYFFSTPSSPSPLFFFFFSIFRDSYDEIWRSVWCAGGFVIERRRVSEVFRERDSLLVRSFRFVKISDLRECLEDWGYLVYSVWQDLRVSKVSREATILKFLGYRVSAEF